MFLCRMSYPAMNDNTHELGKPEFFFLLHILMSFFKYPGMSTKCQYYPAMNGNIIEVAKSEFFFPLLHIHMSFDITITKNGPWGDPAVDVLFDLYSISLDST